jgi:alpha-amylase/alpha-mannosidase (GH57 family)
MSLEQRFPVVLLWHMHQPNYRDAISGSYQLPWTYLHAIKDYVDMAAHLEANPAARAVVNFTPVLIEQLQELAVRVAAHLQSGAALPDPVLAVLAEAPPPQQPEPRLALLRACLRAHKTHLIGRYPAYQELAAVAASLATPELISYASDQFLRDLGVWFHIAWLGETVKRSDLRVAALIERERHFTPQHCRSLLELIAGLLAGVLPRYRALAERGQVELSVTPYAHPLMPLLLDFDSARESQPEVQLPATTNFPGGAERVRWHLAEGQRVFTAAFGVVPQGCWPSEGAISAEVLDLLNAHGFKWAASGGNVLQGCLNATELEAASATHVYQRPGQQLRLLFRDDVVADLVGFTYSSWHGDDAVANCVGAIERAVASAQALAQQQGQSAPTHLLIALDGENAWEYYPYNGYYFLQGLYAVLSQHPTLQLRTIGDVLKGSSATVPLPQVRAGSWVHGTLATWIGDADKNRAWELLVTAKHAVDEFLGSVNCSPEDRARIERQLAQCESSDWFWWFGDYNPPEAMRDFDQLYRRQLASLYLLLKLSPPAALAQSLVSHSAGSDAEGGGVMRRAGQ